MWQHAKIQSIQQLIYRDGNVKADNSAANRKSWKIVDCSNSDMLQCYRAAI